MKAAQTSYCDVITANVGLVQKPEFQTQIKFVRNPGLPIMGGKHSVADFVQYVERINHKYGGINKGWSTWYDRHIALQATCPLDAYMHAFTEDGTNFHPHAVSLSNPDGIEHHVWTEGVQGWGLE